MDNVKKLFGTRIKELREIKGLNQEQLAEMINFESRHLSRIETGNSFTTIENIEKIANALNVDISLLFKFKQHQSDDILLNEINEMLKTASKDQIKLIYKLILSVIC